MPEIIWKSSTEKINGNMQESEICILMQSFKIYYIILGFTKRN